jgi:hypothetical protein
VDWHREADFAEDGGCGGAHPDSIYRAVSGGRQRVERIVPCAVLQQVTGGNSRGDSMGYFGACCPLRNDVEFVLISHPCRGTGL